MTPLGVAGVDLVSGKVIGHPNLGTNQRAIPVPIGDWAVWPRQEAFAWLVNSAAQERTMVAMPTRPGLFKASMGASVSDLPVTTGTVIALGGHLYDPSVSCGRLHRPSRCRPRTRWWQAARTSSSRATAGTG